MKGQSISHYLIKFIHFIQSSLDETSHTAVIAAFIDMSKAFNRVDHSILVQDLYDMHCPAWLLRIFISFLTNRTLIFQYKGNNAEPRNLPGGTPAGSLLGCIFFIIKFNGALLRPPIERLHINPSPKYTKAKYMDDASAAVTIDLIGHLKSDVDERV